MYEDCVGVCKLTSKEDLRSSLVHEVTKFNTSTCAYTYMQTGIYTLVHAKTNKVIYVFFFQTALYLQKQNTCTWLFASFLHAE